MLRPELWEIADSDNRPIPNHLLLNINATMPLGLQLIFLGANSCSLSGVAPIPSHNGVNVLLSAVHKMCINNVVSPPLDQWRHKEHEQRWWAQGHIWSLPLRTHYLFLPGPLRLHYFQGFLSYCWENGKLMLKDWRENAARWRILWEENGRWVVILHC